MNREEFEKYVDSFGEQRERKGIAMQAGCKMRALNHNGCSDNARLGIMLGWNKSQEEIDRLTAEVNHLRWHYPDKGEFPDEGEFIMLNGYDKLDFVTINYSSNNKENYKNLVKRWRYIE